MIENGHSYFRLQVALLNQRKRRGSDTWLCVWNRDEQGHDESTESTQEENV